MSVRPTRLNPVKTRAGVYLRPLLLSRARQIEVATFDAFRTSPILLKNTDAALTIIIAVLPAWISRYHTAEIPTDT